MSLQIIMKAYGGYKPREFIEENHIYNISPLSQKINRGLVKGLVEDKETNKIEKLITDTPKGDDVRVQVELWNIIPWI